MEWRSAIGRHWGRWSDAMKRELLRRHWGRWSDAMKRELLREPDRVLLDRGPEALAPSTEQSERMEPSLELR